jgi:hypothetical protein
VAKIIGQAGIRLVADGSSALARAIRAEVRAAAAEIAAENDTGLLRPVADGTDRDTKKIISNVRQAFGVTGGILSSFSGQVAATVGRLVSITAAAGRLAIIGTLAAGAVAGVAQLTSAVASLVASLGQVAVGGVGIFAAALAGLVAVIATVKVGTAGLSDAFKNIGDPAAFQAALKNLAPSAREFALAVRDIQPAFHDLRLDVQQRLFSGLGTTFTQLATKTLSVIRFQLDGLADALNQGAKRFADVVTQGRNLDLIRGSSANITAGFRALSGAIAPITQALITVVSAGSTQLPRLGTAIAGVAQRFADFIQRTAASGDLEKFFSRALDIATQFGHVIRDLGAGLSNVFSIGSAAGGGFLNILERVAKSFRDWTESVAGQEAITNFFASVRKVADAVLPIFLNLAGVIANNVAPALAGIAQTVGPALNTVVTALGKAITEATPGILAFAQGFADFLTAMAPALPAIGALAGTIAQSLGTVLEAVGPQLEHVAEVLAGALSQALSSPELINGISSLVLGIGSLISGIAPALPSLAKLAGAIGQGLGQVLEKIGPKLGDLITAIADAFTQAVSDPKLIDGLAEIAKSVADLLIAAAPLVPPLARIAADLLPVIADVIKAIIPLMPVFVRGLELLADVVDKLAPELDLVAKGLGLVLGPLDAFGSKSKSTFSSVDGSIDTTTGKFNQLPIDVNRSGLETAGGFLGPTGMLSAGIASMALGAVDNFGLLNDTITGWESGTEGIVARLPDKAWGPAGAAQGLFVANWGANWGTAVQHAETGIAGIIQAVLGGQAPLGSAGSGLGSSFNDGLSVGLGEALRTAQGFMGAIANAFSDTGRFHAAGSAVISSFASGMQSSQGIIESTVGGIMAKVAAFLPHSPAQVGPFSGSGWTPFRGAALMRGFSAGILSQSAAVTAAVDRVLSGAAEPFVAGQNLAVAGQVVPVAVAAPSAGMTLAQTNVMLPGTDVSQFADLVQQRAMRDLSASASSLPVRRQGIQQGVDDGILSGVRT